jgi:hypothetical protein
MSVVISMNLGGGPVGPGWVHGKSCRFPAPCLLAGASGSHFFARRWRGGFSISSFARPRANDFSALTRFRISDRLRSICRSVARVGGAFWFLRTYPVAIDQTFFILRPTPGLSRTALPRAGGPVRSTLPRESGRPSARNSDGAPKRHGVGRVARRARPVIARHSNTLGSTTPPYP